MTNVQENILRAMAASRRREIHHKYMEEGFDVDVHQQLRQDFFIDVQTKDVTVDDDFLDRT